MSRCGGRLARAHEKIAEFLIELRTDPDGYAAMLEVCGFHDWLVHLLRGEAACKDVVVIHPEQRSKKKTDRRDAHRLSELLWVSRRRLLAGQRVPGVRRVTPPTPEERHDRQLTSLRQRLGRQRTRTLNQIHYLLRRRNLEWNVPAKTFDTLRVRRWLRELTLPVHERRELDHLLEQWRMWDQQIEQVQARIVARFQQNPWVATSVSAAARAATHSTCGRRCTSCRRPLSNSPTAEHAHSKTRLAMTCCARRRSHTTKQPDQRERVDKRQST